MASWVSTPCDEWQAGSPGSWGAMVSVQCTLDQLREHATMSAGVVKAKAGVTACVLQSVGLTTGHHHQIDSPQVHLQLWYSLQLVRHLYHHLASLQSAGLWVV